MPEKIVNIDIDEEGNFELDLQGFKGKGCKDIAKLFEKMGHVTQEETKKEYYDNDAQTTVKVGH